MIKRAAAACALIMGILMLGGCVPAAYTSGQTDGGGNPSDSSWTSGLKKSDYAAYIRQYADAETDVPAFTADPADEQVCGRMEHTRITQAGEYGSDKPAAAMEEGGSFDLQFHIDKEGLYTIGIDYYPVEGRGQDIRQSLMIDGTYPFDEAEQIVLSRIWTDESGIVTDSEGNDLYPSQIQAPEWITCSLRDSSGRYTEPLLFYLTEGDHMLRFTSVEEPLVIRSVLFAPRREVPSYQEALAAWREEGLQETADFFCKVQAETPDSKSSPELSAASDRNDPAVEPSDGLKIKLNTLGGGRFDTCGMWVEYTVEAPADGLYRLVFKAKQNNMKDHSAYRNIYINGELPFQEAENFSFGYSDRYENVVFGDKDGAYLVKLNKGDNTVRLEASLGDIAGYCAALEESLEILNAAYRKLVTLTGVTPDADRDYSLDYKMPDVIETFGEQYEFLSGLSETIKEEGGGNTSYTVAIDELAIQLNRMYRNHYDIPANVSSFHTNLFNLGSRVEEMKRTDLTLDYICAAGTETVLPEPTAGFLNDLVYSVKNFVASFFYDYSMIGSAGDYKETIEVWMLGGREQAQILKQIIDSGFSDESGIGVSVKLISDAATLQRAVIAGEGPDVAVGLGQSDAMNFAFRGAVKNLMEYEDFAEISGRFPASAMELLTYSGGVMGLPQTVGFPVLFYREDILEDLDLEVPETWDDVYEMLPVLAQNNMDIGLPLTETFQIMLYQRGGAYYEDDLASATFSDELTIDTVSDWSELYISYGAPISYNFVNRFAAGDMPIAVSAYNAYSTLILYAPQLSGEWSWTTVPGTIREDGSVDHSAPVTITASVILSDTNKAEAAWEFMKWWSGEEVQTNFGRSIENLQGKAGRYETANLQAMEQLPWSGKQYRVLKEQVENTVAIPEIPGGYYTNRYLTNAFWVLYSDNQKGGFEVRKVMYEYDMIVDNEIAYQRNALKKAAEHEKQEGKK